MRITVISSTVFAVPPHGYSGLEQLAWQQAKGLAERGHKVSLVAPDGSQCPGVEMLHSGPAGQHNEHQAYDRHWKSYLQSECLIDNSWEKWSSQLRMEGRLKAPILGVCHAPVNTMFQSLPPEKVISFVCISEDQGEHFRNLFGRDCRVCYNGIDPMFYRPLGIPRSKRFLFLARFSTIKGPDIAIEACREAGVGLDLVGDTQITNEPDFLQKCQRMCDWSDSIEGRSPSLVCRDTIRMVGPATRSECVWWFSQAHALLHPNQRFREPFGLAPVESMACGTPVIAWDHGAMRETVRSGETGWLVNNFQDLVEAIKNARDGSTWELMRPAAREQACKFSVRRMVERYERLCHEAIKNPW